MWYDIKWNCMKLSHSSMCVCVCVSPGENVGRTVLIVAHTWKSQQWKKNNNNVGMQRVAVKRMKMKKNPPRINVRANIAICVVFFAPASMSTMSSSSTFFFRCNYKFTWLSLYKCIHTFLLAFRYLCQLNNFWATKHLCNSIFLLYSRGGLTVSERERERVVMEARHK